MGDSPILGAGLWVDGEVGAAGSTGRGEANLFNLSSHLVVEEMRRGRHPKDAGMEAAEAHPGQHRREAAAHRPRARPTSTSSFYIVDRLGRFAGVGPVQHVEGQAAAVRGLHRERAAARCQSESLLGEGPAA